MVQEVDLSIGEIYRIRLTNGTWTDGRYNGQRVVEGRRYSSYSNTRTTRRYLFTNLATNREIIIKSRVKISHLVRK